MANVEMGVKTGVQVKGNHTGKCVLLSHLWELHQGAVSAESLALFL